MYILAMFTAVDFVTTQSAVLSSYISCNCYSGLLGVRIIPTQPTSFTEQGPWVENSCPAAKGIPRLV